MKKNLLSIFAMAVLMVITAVGYAQTTYTKVNSVSELEAGVNYILVGYDNDGQAFAMGYQKTNNRHALAVNEAGGTITVTVATDPTSQEEVFEFTLEGSTGAWAIYDPLNNGYLCAPGGGNYLRTQAALDDQGKWTITAGEEGGFVPVSNGGVEQNYMRYNKASTLFGCYKPTSTTNDPVYFFKAGGAPVINPEPSNYPTNFTATVNGMDIVLDWNDATGTQLPDKYLVLASAGSITVPTDGTPVATSELAKNVSYGTQTVSFNGLESNTTYHFAIFPYTNSGSNIDYKTDGNYPTATAKTVQVTELFFEGFDTDLGGFISYSVIGEQEWVWATHNDVNYAYMNGYDGGAKENEDWLISPQIPFSRDFDAILLDFKTAKNYNGNPLQVMVSSNFTGGEPSDAYWVDVTEYFNFSTGGYNWVESGSVNILEMLTNELGFFHVAFVYTSTEEAAASWEIDYVRVLGGTVSVKEHEISTVSVYPNPAHDVLSFNLESDAQVNIYDMTGRMVNTMSMSAGQGQCNVANLENGVYFLNIRYNNDKTEVARFVKF